MVRRWSFALPVPVVALALACGVLGGCSPRATTFTRTDVDFGRIHRCAVLPLRNLSPDGKAADRLDGIFLTELLRAGQGLVIVEPGATDAAIRDLRLNVAEPLAPAQVVELGKRLGVEGIFAGAVLDHGAEQNSRDRANVVTAEFSLSETETGALVWQTQVHGTGTSLWRKLFGGESESLYDVSRDVIRKALGTLF
jgi:hypothetical protein